MMSQPMIYMTASLFDVKKKKHLSRQRSCRLLLATRRPAVRTAVADTRFLHNQV
jgi:hypothetical protein